MMHRDPYFEPSAGELASVLADLRVRPPATLAGVMLLINQVIDQAGEVSDRWAAIEARLHAPLPYLPELEGNPDAMFVAPLRGVRLLATLVSDAPATDAAQIALLQSIYDHAEFLYCFNVTRWPVARMLNGAFLTLAGFCLPGFAVSAHWRQAGMARMLSNLEPVGSALELPAIQAAIDLWGQPWIDAFVQLYDEPLGTLATEVVLWVARRARECGLPLLPAWAEYYHQVTNRVLQHQSWTGIGVMSDEEFWAALDLDRPELAAVRAALAADDPEAARAAYAAHVARIAALRDAFFLGREVEVDLAEADEICNNVLTLRAHMHHRHEFGDRVDWTQVLFNDIESNVSLNYHYHLQVLALAWRTTGNETYLAHLVRLLRSWLETSPVNDRWQPALQWRTLEVGNRAGQVWPVLLMAVADAGSFQHELLVDLARSYLEHGRYLLAHHAQYANNWFQVESCGLAVVALLFPEFREAERFWHCALRRMAWIDQVCFLPDGFQAECSTTYHWFPVRGVTIVYELAQRLGRPLPEGYAEALERMLSMYVGMALPDLHAPLLNDCSPALLSVTQPLELAAKLFPARDDFRYLASRRREGRPPAFTSCAFAHAGYYVSRSGWGDAALALVFDAGYYGLGHQHEDKLNFVLHAHGRTLIDDPSIYQYKLDAFEPYWRGPRGHNTIMVDNKGQNRRLLERPEPRPDPHTVWVTGAEFDFGFGRFDDGFAHRSPGPVTPADRASLDRSIRHARALFVVKGAYVLLVDWVFGEGEHEVEQIFHLAPVIEAPRSDGVRAGQVARNGVVVRSSEPGLANIALLPAGSVQPEVRIETGQSGPVRGWSARYGKQPAHDVTYSLCTTLPLALPVVLWPQPPGDQALPAVGAVALLGGAGAVGINVTTRAAADLFIIAPEIVTTRWDGGSFTGQALWARTDSSGVLRAVAAARTTHITIAGHTYHASDQPADRFEA